MKKLLLSAIVMAIACFGTANATIKVIATNVVQPANDTLLFALPVNPECSQEIWTSYQPESGSEMRFLKFQPEYLVTAQDFTRGDVTKGTANLPANAKVIGLALDGFDIGSDITSKGVFHDAVAWCRNIPRDKMTLDYLDLFDGYKTHLPQGQLCTDTVTYRSYPINGVTHPGVVCTFDLTATAENPCTIVDVPFGNPDDPHMPFWYKGENIYLTMWLCNYFDVHMKYHYMAYDDAEAQYASLMRTGNYCFNSESQYDILDYFGMELMYELPEYRIPAFRTPYYTNDIRVTAEGYETIFELRDEDGNVIERNADGNYYSLDHTKTYTVYVTDKARGSFTFDNIYTDIDLIIRNTTAVEEINAGKTVASVNYYNLAGQMSAQPVDGVNIVVTTYTDGTRSTAKVIK
jgi:hypothetical protein